MLPAGPVAARRPCPAAASPPRCWRCWASSPVEPLLDVAENRTTDEKGRPQPPRYDVRPGALVVDATGVREIAQLELLRQVLRPVMKGLEKSGRVIILATERRAVDGLEAKAVAQAIDGIIRTVGKELRGGSTSNLVFVRADTEPADLASTLSFLLEGRSAFVSGQAWRVGPGQGRPRRLATSDRPFAGRIVVVTGARPRHRRGHRPHVRPRRRDRGRRRHPAAGDALAQVANEVRGSALQLDITAPDAGARIADHVASVHGPDARIWAIVHNAGITRDKMLANLDEKVWASVLDVNLAAEMRINEVLLDHDRPGALAEDGRIVGIASTSGWAGNKGQTNYAASKAGVMGLVWAMRDELADSRVTTNGVAPGFIETEMTGKIPFVQREMFRRTNSLSAGRPAGRRRRDHRLPPATPPPAGVDGQVIRVCGQNLIGR